MALFWNSPFIVQPLFFFFTITALTKIPLVWRGFRNLNSVFLFTLSRTHFLSSYLRPFLVHRPSSGRPSLTKLRSSKLAPISDRRPIFSAALGHEPSYLGHAPPSRALRDIISPFFNKVFKVFLFYFLALSRFLGALLFLISWHNTFRA